jgi:hypothetical protein
MKKAVWISALLVAFAVPAWLAVAGDLDPAEGPAPTMKTLEVIEARTPIRAADLPLTISQPGSYYLAEDIATSGAGIIIDSDHVTIDLNGFALSAELGDCIGINWVKDNVTVKNGFVVGCGATGVNLNAATNSIVDGVHASDNALYGIRVGPNSVVVNSVAKSNGSTGITARGGSIVRNCVATQNTGEGISGYEGAALLGCVAADNTLDGIVGAESRIEDCSTYRNGGDGIEVKGDCYAARNLSDGNGGAGIRATITDNRIESNSVTDNVTGISVVQIGNVVLKNTASGNTTNYAIIGGNAVGEILNAAGSTITSANPWANLEF